MIEAVIGAPLGAAKSHPDYAAAKAGNIEAAIRVATSLVTPKLIAQVRSLASASEVVLMPIISVEAAGNNKIPQAVAEFIGMATGLHVTEDVVQADSPKRTSMDGLDRIFNSPTFDGPVIAGTRYILVDDTLTQGATFASLTNHIEQRGGFVIGAIALTGKNYSAKLQPPPQLIEQLREAFGDIEPDFKAATGYGFGALTASEARYLVNFNPSDTVRARIIATGRQEIQSSDAKASGAITPDLVAAFRATDFHVHSQPPFTLNIGKRSQSLADLLDLHKHGGAAFLTAWNPYSQSYTDGDNSALQSKLVLELTRRSLAFISGVGQDPLGIWPGEESFLILGISREEACELGKTFKQNALVWCGRDAIPQLILLL
jgi:hypothetical protein